MPRQIGPNVWEFDSPAGPLRGQGTTVDEAKINALNAYHKAATPPADPKTGKPGKTPDFVGRAKQFLVGELSSEARGASMQGDIRDPSSTVAALKGAGEVVLPGSIEELAVQAATLGAPGVARAIGATGQLARTAVGVGLPTAVGAGAGVAKGDLTGGAALGFAAGTIGEATRLAFTGTGAGLEKITRRWGNLEVRQFNERVREQVGPAIARDINADIPSLRKAGVSVNNAPDVLKLLDDSTGRQVVGRMFDDVEAKVARKVSALDIPRDIAEAAGRTDLIRAAEELAMGSYNAQAKLVAQQLGVPVNDSMVQQVLARAGIQPGATNVVQASGAEAIAMAKQLRHQGLRKGEGLQGRPPRAMAEDIQQRVDAALGSDPLKAEYTQLRDDYSKFMDLRDWLNKNDPSKLFPGMVSKGGATIDLVRFGDAMVKDITDLPPSRFPNLHRTMTGAGTGTRAIDVGGSSLGTHVGAGIPGTHIRVYPSVGKKAPPEVPTGLVGPASKGGIRRAGEIAAGVSRVGTAAAVPTLNE